MVSDSLLHRLLKIQTEERSNAQLLSDIKDSISCVQRLQLQHRLEVHSGCVNSVVWSECGNYIISGSDDRNIVISDPFFVSSPVCHQLQPGHTANIFCVRALPGTNSEYLVSCANDCAVILTNVPCSETHGSMVYRCCVSSVYEVCTLPGDSHTFLCCSEDGTVRQFDRRTKTTCVPCQDDVLVHTPRACCAIDVCLDRPWLMALGCSDGTARIYDRRMLKLPNDDSTGLRGVISWFCPSGVIGGRSKRITSLDFSRDGPELLVSFSNSDVYLINTLKTTRSEDTQLGVAGADEDKLSFRRLRLRGDWSDTGPQSRPADQEAEQAETPPTREATASRMSRLLTGWLQNQLNESEPRQEEPGSPAGQGEVEDGPGPSFVSSESPVVEREDVPTGGMDTLRVKLQERSRNVDAVRSKASSDVHRIVNCIARHVAEHTYSGHRNSRTMMKQACFWGNQHIISGSDCGNMFIWDRRTSRVVKLIEADKHVVNCVQPHPSLALLATSGIDYDIKLWAPTADQAIYDEEEIKMTVQRNQRLSEETRDTVTVPAAMMIRMIAVMNRYRAERRLAAQNPPDGPTSESADPTAESADA